MSLLSQEELDRLMPAETLAYPSPIPTQVVSSAEFLPIPQTEKRQKVHARLNDLADE